MAWANFDQPDLKAVHGFTVSAPETWTVLSNSPSTTVEALPDGGRLWTFADTPRLSTYVTVVNAGPFYELREHRGGYDLGLYCRQSLRQLLDRDAEELFELTEQGLAWFGEHFGYPFAQERYDQVFVPDLGGAMENWGCVTWGDWALARSTPTYDERREVAEVVLHEMAHMWFGDLVTMRWWDDLWLNEAFASWAACWAAVGATRYTDSWASFIANLKLEGYRLDMGPASHPIREDVPDVAQAMANFDQISYSKGQAVLEQLGAYVGEEAFLEGLRAYFRDHAWGNTTILDLIAAVGAASGRDLSEWETAWLDSAGTDTIALSAETLTVHAPDGAAARSHRLDIGCYADTGDGLRHVADVPVQTNGQLHLGRAARVRPPTGQRPRPHVRCGADRPRLARPDAASRRPAPPRGFPSHRGHHRVRHARQGRAQRRGHAGLHPRRARERAPRRVVEPFLRLAGKVAGSFTPVADRCAAAPGRRRGRRTRAGAGARQGALTELANNAVTAEHFDQLDTAAADDIGLAWRVATRRAALGEYDANGVEHLLERDPDPDAPFSALAVRASRPLPEAKEEAWHALYVEQNVPSGYTDFWVINSFWRPEQREVLLPFTWRYLEEIPSSPVAACSRCSP